jgi:DNA-binding MarR family transcriptional regulator
VLFRSREKEIDPQDISRDVVVKVTNKGLEMFKKFMAQK